MAVLQFEQEEPTRHLYPVERPAYKNEDTFVAWARRVGQKALVGLGPVFHFTERPTYRPENCQPPQPQSEAVLLQLVPEVSENRFGEGFD